MESIFPTGDYVNPCTLSGLNTAFLYDIYTVRIFNPRNRTDCDKSTCLYIDSFATNSIPPPT